MNFEDSIPQESRRRPRSEPSGMPPNGMQVEPSLGETPRRRVAAIAPSRIPEIKHRLVCDRNTVAAMIDAEYDEDVNEYFEHLFPQLATPEVKQSMYEYLGQKAAQTEAELHKYRIQAPPPFWGSQQ